MTSTSQQPRDVLQGGVAASRPFLSAQWRYLVMVNWRIDPGLLAPLAPRCLELDTFAGETFVSLVGFLFLDTRLRGLAIPFHRNFAEVNLRYYVRRMVDGQPRRGVIFVKEIVPRHAVSWVARRLYNENYVTMRMRHSCPDGASICQGDRFRYEWRTGGRWHGLQATAASSPQLPSEGSLGQFIAEHYWGYSLQRDGSVMEYEVRHAPWEVAAVEQLQLDCDFPGLYGERFRTCLMAEPASAFVADGSAIEVHRGTRLQCAYS